MATKKQSVDIFNVVQNELHRAPRFNENQPMRRPAEKNTDTFRTPNGSANKRIYPKTNSYSTVLQSKLPVTPQPDLPSQRKRETHITLIDNASAKTVQSVKLPTPQKGKKNVQIGRPIEVCQNAQRKSNPLSKSIWISKFHPTTKPKELENYIVENTPVTNKAEFKCIRLVKKDQDKTKLSYVSFKIEVSPESYAILINPEKWPQDKQIREFVNLSPPKPSLGDFLPSKPPKPNTNGPPTQSSNETEKMDVVNDLTKRNAGTSSSNSDNNNGTDNASSSKNGPN